MRRTVMIVALSLSLSLACDRSGPSTTNEVEFVPLDTETRVRMDLRVRQTFHDPVADYAVTLERRGRPALAVLSGVAQAHNARRSLLATRLSPGGTIAVVVHETLCVLQPGVRAFACHSFALDADLPRTTPEFWRDYRSALRWVVTAQRYDAGQRTRAAVAATQGPDTSVAAQLQTIDSALEQIGRQNRHEESTLELRAHRLRIAPQEGERDALEREIREGNGARSLAIARGCARALDPALDARSALASESFRRELATTRQRCRRQR